MNKLRLAVLGAGQFGRNHCRVVHESERAELVAVVDIDPARASEAARSSGAEALSGTERLEGRVDAAIVAVPNAAGIAIAGQIRAPWEPRPLESDRHI